MPWARGDRGDQFLDPGAEGADLRGKAVDLGQQDGGQFAVVGVEPAGQRLDEGGALGLHPAAGQLVATLGAIGARGVRHLIYIAAVLTEAGRPSLSPPPSVPVKGHETLRPEVIIMTDTTTIIDREVSLAAFYHDVEPSLARQAASRLRPFQKTGYAVIETDAVAAWRTIPTTYVVCAEDRMVHPDTQREMAAAAAAAGAEVLEWPSSHSPFLSHPDLVADLVAQRAAAMRA